MDISCSDKLAQVCYFMFVSNVFQGSVHSLGDQGGRQQGYVRGPDRESDGDPSVHRTTLNQPSHIGQAYRISLKMFITDDFKMYFFRVTLLLKQNKTLAWRLWAIFVWFWLIPGDLNDWQTFSLPWEMKIH